MLENIDSAHQGVPTVGCRAGAPADDFIDASLVDCRVAFWGKNKIK